MLRLAIFLCCVLLLFKAGSHRVAEPLAAAPAAKVALQTLTSRIGGPKVARTEPAMPALPRADLPQSPAPLPSAETRAADPARLAPRPQDAGRRFTVEVTRLPLRSGPSQIYPELGALSRGETVLLSGDTTGEWLWVRAQKTGVSGYVAARYVAPAGETAGERAESAAARWTDAATGRAGDRRSGAVPHGD
ncbi:SH3 domain-containing protein [Albidovulum sp.]|jgi:uncharacterized protein YgiM (DUF1202 family)|uniref:SH3 domain-containing protein n=1 Tax=Albidovulum sp. TaxID=1872424 RepID=UPI003047E5F4